MRRTQLLPKRPKFLPQPMSKCYNGYMVNNNNIVKDPARYAASTRTGTKETITAAAMTTNMAAVTMVQVSDVKDCTYRIHYLL